MKYRKVAECPQNLADLIEVFNYVPNGGNYLPSWDTLLNNAYSELTGISMPIFELPENYSGNEDWQPPSYEQHQALDEAHSNAIILLKNETKFFPKLYSYLFEMKNDLSPENQYNRIRNIAKQMYFEREAPIRYTRFLQIRENLRNILQACAVYQKNGRFTDNGNLLRAFGRKSRNYQVDFEIDQKGKISFGSDLVKALSDIDAKRLRVCPICKRIFWLKRIEKEFASPCSEKRCSNNFHQRNRRIKEYQIRVDKEFKTLGKLRATVSSENSLVSSQEKR